MAPLPTPNGPTLSRLCPLEADAVATFRATLRPAPGRSWPPGTGASGRAQRAPERDLDRCRPPLVAYVRSRPPWEPPSRAASLRRPPEQKATRSNRVGRTTFLREKREVVGLRILGVRSSGFNVAVSRGRVGVGVSARFRDSPLAQALERGSWLFEAEALSSCRVDRGEAVAAPEIYALRSSAHGRLRAAQGRPARPRFAPALSASRPRSPERAYAGRVGSRSPPSSRRAARTDRGSPCREP